MDETLPTIPVEKDEFDVTEGEYITAEELAEKYGTRVPTIFAKLVKLMKLVGTVPKDKVNEFQHYKYASASATMEKVQSGLIELGISVNERFVIMRVDEVGDRKILNYIVKCILTLTDEDTGDDVETSAFGSGMDTGDKGIMKAQTAARKYAWWGLLCVGTPDDPEADTATDAIGATPIRQPASSSGTVSGGEQLTMAKVLAVTQDAPNRPYTISTDHGEFKTFDKNVAASAELARSTGLEMEIHWRQNPNPKYNDRLIISKK